MAKLCGGQAEKTVRWLIATLVKESARLPASSRRSRGGHVETGTAARPDHDEPVRPGVHQKSDFLQTSGARERGDPKTSPVPGDRSPQPAGKADRGFFQVAGGKPLANIRFSIPQRDFASCMFAPFRLA